MKEWKTGAEFSALGIARRFNACPGDLRSQRLGRGKVDNIHQKSFDSGRILLDRYCEGAQWIQKSVRLGGG